MPAKSDRSGAIKLDIKKSTEKCSPVRAIVREALSKPTEMTIEMVLNDGSVMLEDLLGEKLQLQVTTEDDGTRVFTGVVISVEALGFRNGKRQVVIEARPEFWMLNKAGDCRVFQNKSTKDIITEVLKAHGLSDYRFSLSGEYVSREYCVQYRESDFDFLSRLMEEEGLYYFFDSTAKSASEAKMVICDGPGAHRTLPGSPFKFVPRTEETILTGERISEWATAQTATTGKISLQDFDFERPEKALQSKSKIAKGKHSYKNLEHYDYPGHMRFSKDDGKKAEDAADLRSRVRMEAEAARFVTWRGTADITTMSVGGTFEVSGKDHLQIDQERPKEFLLTEAVHYLQEFEDFNTAAPQTDLPLPHLDFPEQVEGRCMVMFSAMPKTEPYRAPLATPWPRIPGLHTATVVGQKGEEIHTDEFGRIKVHFHWDRVGKYDEQASCWVRVVTPWSGNNWGMVAVPRVGQEVVVQFEEGDPDRPICTGMLYNSKTRPPYKYPDEATQSGLKSNSSKGGGGFNELMFEDKKDAELVRFQSQKDYEQIVKDNATVTIGGGDNATGDLTQTVKNNVTQTIEEGNHSLTIKQGNQDITVSQGDMGVDVSQGSVMIEAARKITLKVGMSSIELTPGGIEIKGTNINVKGEAKLDANSPLTTVKATGVLTLQGSLTKIN